MFKLFNTNKNKGDLTRNQILVGFYQDHSLNNVIRSQFMQNLLDQKTDEENEVPLSFVDYKGEIEVVLQTVYEGLYYPKEIAKKHAESLPDQLIKRIHKALEKIPEDSYEAILSEYRQLTDGIANKSLDWSAYRDLQSGPRVDEKRFLGFDT